MFLVSEHCFSNDALLHRSERQPLQALPGWASSLALQVRVLMEQQLKATWSKEEGAQVLGHLLPHPTTGPWQGDEVQVAIHTLPRVSLMVSRI